MASPKHNLREYIQGLRDENTRQFRERERYIDLLEAGLLGAAAGQAGEPPQKSKAHSNGNGSPKITSRQKVQDALVGSEFKTVKQLEDELRMPRMTVWNALNSAKIQPRLEKSKIGTHAAFRISPKKATPKKKRGGKAAPGGSIASTE